MQENTNQTPSKFGRWLKTSVTAQMIIVGILILILLIPLSFVQDLIDERSSRQEGVIEEINEKWGNAVNVYGPIMKVPYKEYTEEVTYKAGSKVPIKTVKTNIRYFYLFPENLDNQATAQSKILKRGNFESSVFTAQMHFTGKYVHPSLEEKGIIPKDVLWKKATIEVRTTNLKGIKNELRFDLNKKSYAFETKAQSGDGRNSYYDVLSTNFLDLPDTNSLIETLFSFTMKFNGSKEISLIPIGKTTTMKMKSNWQHPSFKGNYLPNDETKVIGKEGFEADWKVLHINRAFSQIHLHHLPNLDAFAFGTEFVVMVDEYQKSERSTKYGFLVIALTFLVFFLVQVINGLDIHPLQYLLIGLALIMFYTLLISISEHSNFLKAYLVAGVSVITLIGLYTKSVLKYPKFALLITISLSTIYSFIYVIIQLESYALLVGSIGLFLILAAVMYVSRKIDWKNG